MPPPTARELRLRARRAKTILRPPTAKPPPKDVDLLVVVEDVPLGPLAKLKRRLQAKTMQTGDSRGADVFLANPAAEYLGRLCHWRECRPGIRQACEAQHCGRREFLYDDLQNVRLDSRTIAHSPLLLWPSPGPGGSKLPVPADVAELLLAPLQADVKGCKSGNA